MSARPIARMRYDEKVPARLLPVAVLKEVLLFCQAGRVSHDVQKVVAQMWQDELDDREIYGDNYDDWEGSYKARHGVEPGGTEGQN